MLGTVFHYAVVEPEADHARCEAQAQGVIAMHERMGYRQGGAYNGHFCQHGGIWISYTGPNQATGHQWANLNLHAWCYLGTVGTPLTPAAQQAAYDLTLFEPSGRDQMYPHSAFFATSCCGDPLRDWITWGALPPGNVPARGGSAPMYHVVIDGPAPGNPRTFKVDDLQILAEIGYGDPRGLFGIHLEAWKALEDHGVPIVDGAKVPPFGTEPLIASIQRYTEGGWKPVAGTPGAPGVTEAQIRAVVADVLDGSTIRV